MTKVIAASPNEITLLETTPTTGTLLLGDVVGVALLVGVTVGVGVSDGDGVIDLLGVGVGAGDLVAVAEGDGRGVADLVGVGVGDGVVVVSGSSTVRVMDTGAEGPKLPDAACVTVIVALPGFNT